MPRIRPGAIRRALTINSHLAQLLPVCRDLRSAQLELRWLQEHATNKRAAAQHWRPLLDSFVRRRSRGEPLQYILGTEFFGDLELKCRPGVLIPRQDTAAAVTHLVDLLSRSRRLPKRLAVLDLCTGSGCIPLLFQHQFYSFEINARQHLKLTGVDISRTALDLSKENLTSQQQALASTHARHHPRRVSLEKLDFVEASVLDSQRLHTTLRQHYGRAETPRYDVLISNPPYISAIDFRRTTARSVRQYEPKLALIPSSLGLQTSSPTSSMRDGFMHDGDLFYPHLLKSAQTFAAKVVLLEVADIEQAKRVAALAVESNTWRGIEIWLDEPSHESQYIAEIGGASVKVVGSGMGRSVLLYRGEGMSWLGKWT